MATAIDIQIAKLRGESLEHLPPQYVEWVTPDGKDGGSGFVCPRCGADEDGYLLPCCKNYTGDIAAAFALLDEMPHSFLHHHTNADDNYWACTCTPVEMQYTGKTAHIAICRAWLAWKEDCDGR